VAADELQEARELGVAGRLGDCAVEFQVLVDRRAARGARRLDRLERIEDGAQLRLAGALRGEARRLDLDAQAQLHYAEDVLQRLHAFGFDAEGCALRLGCG
jgi:hypothetical protein